MELVSIGAESLLDNMREQIATVRNANPQQVRQIEAQTGRELESLAAASPGSKGSQLDVLA